MRIVELYKMIKSQTSLKLIKTIKVCQEIEIGFILLLYQTFQFFRKKAMI
jgi:hypothetical protein